MIAILVLNQIVGPFASKWNRDRLFGAFEDKKNSRDFEMSYEAYRRNYETSIILLAEISKADYLTDLEQITGV